MQNEYNFKNELSRLVYYDRYAMKGTPADLELGMNVVCIDHDGSGDALSGKRMIGIVKDIIIEDGGLTSIVAEIDGVDVTFDSEHYDVPIEQRPEETWVRVARAATKNEKDSEYWFNEILSLLRDWALLPGGRILTAAGTVDANGEETNLTNVNCFVLDPPLDDMASIMDNLKSATLVSKSGGGYGISLSSLRPKGTHVRGVNGKSSGAVSFGSLYTSAGSVIQSGGSRRSAIMLSLEDFHPDIENFAKAKRAGGVLTQANLSVGVSDDFMQAVKDDGDWTFIYPQTDHPAYNDEWGGSIKAWVDAGHPIIEYKTVKARELFHDICENAWHGGDPGMLFLERANRLNNMRGYTEFHTSNPCGEQIMSSGESCVLGAINLTKFLHIEDEHDYTNNWLDIKTVMNRVVPVAIRFLDNIIDITKFPLPEVEKNTKNLRRIGLGITGLGEVLIALGYKYGSEDAIAFTKMLFNMISDAAYIASADLAVEKGKFPAYQQDAIENSEFIKRLSPDVRDYVLQHGLRNSHLITIAPTGSTSAVAGVGTSGIEPAFLLNWQRTSRLGTHEDGLDIYKRWIKNNPDKELPDYFVTAMEITPHEHVDMQAAAQYYVDSAISKTINLTNSATVEDIMDIYMYAYDQGTKGITIYRDGSLDVQVLSAIEEDNKEEPVFLPVDDSVEYERPESLEAVVYRRKSSVGTVYTTIAYDEVNGIKYPTELFVTVGKSGSREAGLLEGVGRLVSLHLQSTYIDGRRDELYTIAQTLKGIGGDLFGFGSRAVLSVPDLVAQILLKWLDDSETANGNYSDDPNTLPDTPLQESPFKVCPSCGEQTLIVEEGCSHCTSCSFSACG